MKNKPERDFNIVFHINERYSELSENFANIATYEQFHEAKNIRKSILFDLFQIGELLNHLSSDFVNSFGKEEIDLVIGTRNVIVHGYGEVNDNLVYKSIKFELPNFIERLNELSRTRYKNMLDDLIGTKVTIYQADGFYYTDRLTTLSGALQKLELVKTGNPFYGKTATVKGISKKNNEYILLVE